MDLFGDVEAAGIVVELLSLEIMVDFAEETIGLLEKGLVVDLDDERRLHSVHGGLTHQRTMGLVVIIVRVGESLVGVVVGRETSGELVGSGMLSRLQIEVLIGHSIDSFSLVTEGLRRQSVD